MSDPGIDDEPRTASLETHTLSRILSAAHWPASSGTASGTSESLIARACRKWFPELAAWSDTALATAYRSFAHDYYLERDEGPTSRDIDFLIYLYLVQYQVPHAIGDFRSAGAPLVESALREIERLWLGDMIAHKEAEDAKE